MSAVKFIATFAAYIFLCMLGLSVIYLGSHYALTATFAATGGNAVLAFLASCAVMSILGGTVAYIALYFIARNSE